MFLAAISRWTNWCSLMYSYKAVNLCKIKMEYFYRLQPQKRKFISSLTTVDGIKKKVPKNKFYHSCCSLLGIALKFFYKSYVRFGRVNSSLLGIIPLLKWLFQTRTLFTNTASKGVHSTTTTKCLVISRITKFQFHLTSHIHNFKKVITIQATTNQRTPSCCTNGTI